MSRAARLAHRAGHFALLIVRRLRIGHKLLLIFALDFSAVVAVGALLIHEQFLAIDFARKEREGIACIEAMMPSLLAAGDSLGTAHAAGSASLLQSELDARRWACGDARPALRALERWQTHETPARTQGGESLRREALVRGLELIRTIGNTSNLVLDPELRSYYAMSIVVLRLPELLALSEDFVTRARALQEWGAGASGDERVRLLVLGGQVDALARGTMDDLNAALAATPDGDLSRTLAAPLQRLNAALALVQATATQAQAPSDAAALRDAGQAMLAELAGAWMAGAGELDRLLDKRLDELYARLWRRLGLVFTLLTAILGAVTFVARQITRPVESLAETMTKVRQTGDYSLRARWHGRDELGALVDGFNAMLADLDRARARHEEYVAAQRAGQAQQELVDAIPIPLIITARDGSEVLHANAAGLARLNGVQQWPWQRALPAVTADRLIEKLKRHTELHEFEVRWQAPGSAPSWAVLSARSLRYQGSEAVLATLSPINRLKQMEQRLALWSQVVEACSEGIVITDARLRIVSVNQAFCRISGHDADDLVGRECSTLMAERPVAREVDGFWRSLREAGVWRGELLCRHRDGSSFPTWIGASVVRDAEDEVSHHIFTTVDISERKRNEERIAFLAHHDALTGLPNRALCLERLGLALRQAGRNRDKVAVLFLDLDRFKAVNDSLGHQAGDALLRSVAHRLAGALRTTDTVARLGGDEFVVVLTGLASAEEASDVIERRILPVLRAPHEIAGRQLQALGSVGVAVFPEDASSIETLMRHADLAMYQAKQSGRGRVCFYTAQMDQASQEHLQLQRDLKEALDREQLQLQYQPRIDALSGRLVALEALLHWNHASQGLVPNARLVTTAEECGLIVPIGQWAIDRICTQLASWQDTPLRGIPVSIDAAPGLVNDSRLVGWLCETLKRHALSPSLIELELPEATLMREGMAQRLQALKSLGVRLAVDDFGTGHSSVSELAQLPVDKLKIDRSLVTPLGRHPGARRIVDAIVTLGHALKLKVVAEGVERAEVADELRAARCDELQGAVIAKPMPANRLPAWLGVPQPAAVAGVPRAS